MTPARQAAGATTTSFSWGYFTALIEKTTTTSKAAPSTAQPACLAANPVEKGEARPEDRNNALTTSKAAPSTAQPACLAANPVEKGEARPEDRNNAQHREENRDEPRKIADTQ